MDDRQDALTALHHLIHRYFIWLVLLSYAVAACFPGPGLAIRALSLGKVDLLGSTTRVTLPVLMLAFLIFNAGMGVRVDRLKGLVIAPLAPLAGLLGNIVIPVAYIFVVAQTMRLWHNPDEVQNILVGLALVASMPIAGSSTAWSQNADGNLALSLGLVLGSTLLSPVTTPLALHAVGWMTKGDYAEDLLEIAQGGVDGFLLVSVILPSLLGIVVRQISGEGRVARVNPLLKLLNSAMLLLLNYSNASLSLPQAVSHPDWDFLVAILVIVVGLCALAFAGGAAIARLLKVDHGQKVSLMFGLGMNNNGTGLVLASIALSDHPKVLLPIIFYNLVQHLVAAAADLLLRRAKGGRDVLTAEIG